MAEYTIRNLENACRLLKSAASWQHPFRVSEASQRLSIPRTTVIRIVHALTKQGLLQESDGLYRLGGVLLNIKLGLADHLDLDDIARPVLRELRDATGETAYLGIWDNGKTLISKLYNSEQPLRADSAVGSRVYSHTAAAGKILMAYRFYDVLSEIWPASERVALTSNSITELSDLQQELATVRKQGWAIDDEEYFLDIRCLACPVYDQNDEVFAAIGITAPKTRFPEERNQEMFRMVQEAAEELSKIVAKCPTPLPKNASD
tara:strand:- start:343 stop:1128 length:786 start_codon:yes stop_codon:yes gene_type:complete